jgi:hypothetical protein
MVRLAGRRLVAMAVRNSPDTWPAWHPFPDIRGAFPTLMCSPAREAGDLLPSSSNARAPQAHGAAIKEHLQ